MGFMLFSGNKKEPFGFKGFSALWAQKVLKIDRPWAGGFLGLTALGAEGCGGLWTRLGRREGSEGCGGGCRRKYKFKRGRGFAAGCVVGLCSLRSGGRIGLSTLSRRDIRHNCSTFLVPPRSGVPSGGTTTRRILQLSNSPSFSAGPLFYRGRRSTVLRRRDC